MSIQDYIVTANVIAIGVIQACAADLDSAKVIACALQQIGAQRIQVRKWNANAEHYSEFDGPWNQSKAA